MVSAVEQLKIGFKLRTDDDECSASDEKGPGRSHLPYAVIFWSLGIRGLTLATNQATMLCAGSQTSSHPDDATKDIPANGLSE